LTPKPRSAGNKVQAAGLHHKRGDAEKTRTNGQVGGVSDLQRKERADAPACSRCHAPGMSEVASVAATPHKPGLIAYECPRCGHLTSVIKPSDE
jgi:hypothetical protein